MHGVPHTARKSKEVTEEMLLKRSERNKRRKLLADKRKEKTKVCTYCMHHFIDVCVCVCARACVCTCVHACMCVCIHVTYICVHVCMFMCVMCVHAGRYYNLSPTI